MKRLLAIIVLALAPCLPVRAQEEWTGTQQALAATALVLVAADWAQTRYIARNPDRFRELNPLLPEHPTVAQVNRHFALSIAAGAVLAHFLPSEWRTVFLGSVVVAEASIVGRNFKLGIKASW